MSIDSISPPLPGMLLNILMLPDLGYPYALRKRLTPDLKPRLRLPGLLNLLPNSSAQIVQDDLPNDSYETGNLSGMNFRPQYQYARSLLQTTKEISRANVNGEAQSNKTTSQLTVLPNGQQVQIVKIEKQRASDKTGEGNNRRVSISEYVRRVSTLRAQQPDDLILKSVPKALAMVHVTKTLTPSSIGFHTRQNVSTFNRKGSEAHRSMPAMVWQIHEQASDVLPPRMMLPGAHLLNTQIRPKINIETGEHLRGEASMLIGSPPPDIYRETERSPIKPAYRKESSVREPGADDETTDRRITARAISPMSETIIVQQFVGANESEVRGAVEEVLLELINAANSKI